MDECKIGFMKESLYKQFLSLVEASECCSDDELVIFTKAMIEIYTLLSGDSFSNVL